MVSVFGFGVREGGKKKEKEGAMASSRSPRVREGEKGSKVNFLSE